MKPVSTSTPRPGIDAGTGTNPSAFIVHSGVTTSRAQYRALGLRSPGSWKFGRLAKATLYARPIPLSNIPPHHTGTTGCAAAHRSWIASAVSYTHLRAHETGRNLVCRLLLEK